ncbi:MAG: response regulator [Dongiaceae bacterium]
MIAPVSSSFADSTAVIALAPKPSSKIMVVEDDRVLMMMLSHMLTEMNHEVIEARNGREAYDHLTKDLTAVDVILLDHEMPEMDGLQLIAKIKKNHRLARIPVVMQTGSDKPEQIKEGIDAGVFYYLTKPVLPEILKSVLTAALRETEQQRLLSIELQKHRNSFTLIDHCALHFHTLIEAEHLACFLANCYPNPSRVLPGLAELLINAVEHGNLEIGYGPKGFLVERGIWREEVLRRGEMPEYSKRKVNVVFTRESSGITIVITDEGKGFDWHSYLHLDPKRAGDNHGRGIAQANIVSFDRLSYNPRGNQVTAFVSFSAPLG